VLYIQSFFYSDLRDPVKRNLVFLLVFYKATRIDPKKTLDFNHDDHKASIREWKQVLATVNVNLLSNLLIAGKEGQ
jgi:hypothetical protein